MLFFKKNKTADSYNPSKEYKIRYNESIENPDVFWRKESEAITWIKKPNKIKNTSFQGDINIKWFEDGQLNVCYNCVDRHVEAGRGNELAIIWEGDNSFKYKYITYNILLKEVSIFANILENQGVKKGDNVVIYMPMIVEAVYAMLACARIGAVHSVIYGGFSAESIKTKISDCNAKLIITADETVRRGKVIPLKANIDLALSGLVNQINVLVVKNTGNQVNWYDNNFWYNEEKQSASYVHKNIAVVDAEYPLFILYTSGATGKPKGLVHSSAGYLLYSGITFANTFEYNIREVFWCYADIGWITGHSYVVYGPLMNGATTVMFEGVHNYPDPSRLWQIIDKHNVNIFYTSPTIIRSLTKENISFVKTTSRKSLRLLGSVGEPINSKTWSWYNDVVGNKKCNVIDTWWQTETGGHMITCLPSHAKSKVGYSGLPFFSIRPAIVNNSNVTTGACRGNLYIKDSWPGQARTIYGDHKKFKELYFSQMPGLYFTGDGAIRDEDGYYKITGRIDDLLNISGNRIGTAEIEAPINKHSKVCESAVVGIYHKTKGESICAFVVLNKGELQCLEIIKEIKYILRKEIGSIAVPDKIYFVSDLPKTRSGKILRRIIRRVANNSNVGDLNHVINPQSIDELLTIVEQIA